VYDRLGVPVPSTSEGNRVSRPIFSAANWSSETVFLKPPRPGNRADVNLVISEVWPLAPVWSGCESPENRVKSFRTSWRISR
jgi:hypothetical protein